MADDEQFSLCWNNFNSNLSAGFHESLCRGDLVDVTLAAEGQFVKAHRLVLSVCSPYFRKMFTQMPANQHAFVFLKDVSHTALKDLIQFMYCGEVNVKQEALPAFISTAEALQIKGLTDSDPPPSQSPAEPSTPTPQIQQIALPRIRQRTSTSRSYKIESVEDSGDDNKQTTQIVIQATAAPPQQQTSTIAQTQNQPHTAPQQIANTTTATTATVVSHKRPARNIGSVPHIKRTKSTIDPLDTNDASSGAPQITVQTTVLSASTTDSKTQVQQQQSETEYIDLPIELPTKSEPDYVEDARDVDGTENEASYVEDDSYGELRYDESYFTENDEAAAGTTTGQTGEVAGGGTNATTSKSLVKQQESFTDASYVDAADQTNSDAQAHKLQLLDANLPESVTPIVCESQEIKQKRRRGPGRSKQQKVKEEERLVDKVLAAVGRGNGEPALYASTTKGGVKLIYEGHHFRFTFRRGKYSIFQCCFKENMQECKVRVVTDQKRVFPLDGEHVHFMQATDRSVTSMTFGPDGEADELDRQEQELNDAYDEYEIQLIGSTQSEDRLRVVEMECTEEFTSGQNEQSTETPSSLDTNDFREKIKRRLQKALLVMQHVRNCGPQLFIISRKGGTLLAINDFIYRSNLKRFGRNSDKVYWECIHNRSKKCRSRLKTIGDDLYVTNDVHNHMGDGQRIALARRAGMLIYKKFSSIGQTVGKMQ